MDKGIYGLNCEDLETLNIIKYNKGLVNSTTPLNSMEE